MLDCLYQNIWHFTVNFEEVSFETVVFEEMVYDPLKPFTIILDFRDLSGINLM